MKTLQKTLLRTVFLKNGSKKLFDGGISRKMPPKKSSEERFSGKSDKKLSDGPFSCGKRSSELFFFLFREEYGI